MIAFLRNELGKRTDQNDQNNLFSLQNSLPLMNFDYFSKQNNLSSLSQIQSTCKNKN